MAKGFKNLLLFSAYGLITFSLGCLTKSETGSTGLFAPPPEVTGIANTVNSTTQITINWTSGGATTSDYKIAYTSGATAPSDCATGTTVSAEDITGTSHAITGLTPGTQYSFRVCAINANPYPDVASGTTTSGTTWELPPPNPTNLSVTIDSSSAVTLSWTSGGGSTSDYQIAYQRGSSAPGNCSSGTQIAAAAVSGTNHQITGLTGGYQYAFRVCAINTNPTPDVSSGITESATVWWNSNWTRRKTLTFANGSYAENLTNFPVLVVLTQGARINYTKTQDSGQDLRFIDANSNTELDYEIEQWDESGTSYVWVEVPQIDSSSDADYIWMYYGNTGAAAASSATATWSGYAGAWHLNEDPTNTTAKDATSNMNDGNIINDVTSFTTNLFAGKAYDFDGTGDQVTVPQAATLDFAGDATIEGWFRLDSAFNSASATTQGLMSKYVDGNVDFGLTLTGTDYLRANMADGSLVYKLENSRIAYKQTNRVSWSADTWYYFALTLDSSNNDNNLIYINGSDDTAANDDVDVAAANDLSDIAGPFTFGGGSYDAGQIAAGTAFLDGKMDEIRISSSIRSANWIGAQYKSMTDTYCTFGSAENSP